jgi:hypothetical protein
MSNWAHMIMVTIRPIRYATWHVGMTPDPHLPSLSTGSILRKNKQNPPIRAEQTSLFRTTQGFAQSAPTRS